MSHSPIRVLVLHEDPIARVGLESIFARYSDLQVVKADTETADLSIPVRPLSTRTADVVVADYAHGVKLASARIVGVESCRVVIVANSSREWEIRRALECGVRGYILAGCDLGDLAEGVRTVHRGIRFLSPQVSLHLAEILAGEPLTAREEEVLRLVVDGLCNKAIASRLDIAVGTVKSHLKGIFDKLDVGSRTQAIRAAEDRGLLRDRFTGERRPAASDDILRNRIGTVRTHDAVDHVQASRSA